MADNNGRWGISLLSKNRFTESHKEELMIDKSTGELVIKDTYGNIISYDYSTRRNNIITKCINIAQSNNLMGGIYSIKGSNSDIEMFPYVIDAASNIDIVIPQITNLCMELAEKAVFYFDIEVFPTVENTGVIQTSLTPIIKISSNGRGFIDGESIYNINNYIWDIPYSLNDDINIDGINVITDTDIPVRYIIHGIYMITDKVMSDDYLYDGTTRSSTRDIPELTLNKELLVELTSVSPDKINIIQKYIFDKNISSYISTNKDYIVGDLIYIMNGNSYDIQKCISPTSGIYDSTKWVNTTLVAELQALMVGNDDPDKGFNSKVTVFNSDGSITVTYDSGERKVTVFNSDGSITETTYDSSNVVKKTIKTVFNSDGSITETVL